MGIDGGRLQSEGTRYNGAEVARTWWEEEEGVIGPGLYGRSGPSFISFSFHSFRSVPPLSPQTRAPASVCTSWLCKSRDSLSSEMISVGYRLLKYCGEANNQRNVQSHRRMLLTWCRA